MPDKKKSAKRGKKTDEEFQTYFSYATDFHKHTFVDIVSTTKNTSHPGLHPSFCDVILFKMILLYTQRERENGLRKKNPRFSCNTAKHL